LSEQAVLEVEKPEAEEALPDIGDFLEEATKPKEAEAPETNVNVNNQVLTDVLQGKMAGLDDEAIKERIKERYGMDDVEAEMTLQMVMKLLEKKQDQEFQLKKATLGVVPALAQSKNPLAPLLLQSLIAQAGVSRDDDIVREFAEVQKQAMKLKLIKKMFEEDEKKPSGDFNDVLKALILEMIKDMKAEKEKKEELLYKLLLEKKQDEGQALREVLADLIDYLDQRLQMIADATQSQPVEASAKKDPLEEMAEFSEKLKRMTEALESLGFKVEKPDKEDPFKAFELQLKLKELEMKHKEAEAKRAFMEKIADAFANLLSNPQNLQILLNAITGIFRRGPAPAVYDQAGAVATGNMPAPEPPKVEDLPDIDEFLSEGEAGGGGGA